MPARRMETWGDLPSGRTRIIKQLRRFRALVAEPCAFSGKLFEDRGVYGSATWEFSNNFADFVHNLMLATRKMNHGDLEVPYSLYFMSRNLEHALLDKQSNYSGREKKQFTQEFRRIYAKRSDLFKQLLEETAEELPHDYQGSWDYIRQGTHSLERHSNLVLALDEILDFQQKYDSTG